MLYIFFLLGLHVGLPSSKSLPKANMTLFRFFLEVGWVGTTTFPDPDPQHSNKEAYVEAQF
jgi:hypothetical protein